MDAVTHPPTPVNEPNLTYAPGSPEREALVAELARQEATHLDLTATIGGTPQDRRWRGVRGRPAPRPPARPGVRPRGLPRPTPGRRSRPRARRHRSWAALDFDDRAAVLLKAADLLAGPWRQRLNAATMLGQSKTAYQAEIDAACELIDFWRFNVHFARQILAEQPMANSRGIWNRTDHRPLEGFVYAITPFNFTAIAGNLPTAPALMGNTVVWKPSPTQQVAAHLTMQLLEEAGMPPGVINMLPGDGLDVSAVALAHRDLAGIHFTGSTPTFQHLWRSVGENITGYRSYPRIVGETGGKDFVVAHASADPDVLRTALIRGAFEFQGQKCSAASRAYVARSVWDADQGRPGRGDRGAGDGRRRPTSSNFMGAVIDERAFAKHRKALARAKRSTKLDVARRRQGRRQRGLVRAADDRRVAATPTDADVPHRVLRPDPRGARLRGRRLRGRVVDQMESFAPYALTGSIIAQDRRPWPGPGAAPLRRRQLLRQRQADRRGRRSAAVRWRPGLGHQRQGRRRRNLLRWTSPRSIKETFVPPTDHRYPSMG